MQRLLFVPQAYHPRFDHEYLCYYWDLKMIFDLLGRLFHSICSISAGFKIHLEMYGTFFVSLRQETVK